MISVLTLAKIKLYLNNPRLPKTESEQEALYRLISDQNRKLVQLAKDIVIHKLSELDVIAVFPDTEEDGYFRVAEGNRRITALKLLQNPDLIKEKFPALASEFALISGRETFDYEHITVSIFASEKDPQLIHFLQVRHIGEMGGIGTVKWDAKQKGRFDYSVDGKENLVIFLDELERKEILTQKEINGVTKTNWDRILRPVGLEFFHLVKEKGTYRVQSGFEDEFAKKMKLVATALQGKTVSIVYDQRNIEEFFERMQRQYSGVPNPDEPRANGGTGANGGSGANGGFGDHGGPRDNGEPGDNGGNGDNGEPGGDEESGDNGEAGNNGGSNSNPKGKRNPKDPFKDCPTVIPSSYRMQSRNHRITQIIQELKEIEVEKCPNACGCLLRAMIELCAKEYLEHNGIQEDATKLEFQEVISAAGNAMVKAGTLTAGEAKEIRKETEGGGVRELFNGYMHNTDSYPSAMLIKGIFYTYKNFLIHCLH